MKNLGYVTFTGENLEQLKQKDSFKSVDGITIYETIEDSLRNTNLEEEKEIALVQGIGESYSFDSEYYGYYNLRNYKEIKVLKVLTVEEIIQRAKLLNRFNAPRMFSSYKLPEEVLDELSEENHDIKASIDYYQRGKKDAFNKKAKSLVKIYGQNNCKGCTRE